MLCIQQENGSKNQIGSIQYSPSRVRFSGVTEEQSASHHN